MNSAGSDDAYTKSILLAEYQRLCAEIRSIESSNEKVVGFGLTLISAGLVTGIAQDVDAVFLVLPAAILGVLFYGLMTYTNIFSMAGYKRHLEDQINDHVGGVVLVWEQLVLNREKNNIARITLVSIYAIISMCVAGVSIFRLFDAYGPIVGWIMSGLVILLVLLLFIAARGMGRMNENAYAISKDLSG
ncbi:MAG TPA: hypothetical protein EYN14_07325 [Alphaproteobacteria bacterium]|nr:hypothetical protein [Alphaproteobacteria bacterium]